MTRIIDTEFAPLEEQVEKMKKCAKNISNSIYFIHSDVCHLLNFGGLTQEEASDMASHYNAIRDTISKYRKDIIDKDYRGTRE